MKKNTSGSILRAITIGVVAGMRSALAPAIACHILSKHKTNRIGNSPIKFMQSDRVVAALKVFAVGELIADKLPFVPARTEPGGVVARVISGGLSAAALARSKGSNVLTGTILGSVSALASTYACYLLRREAGKKFDIYDPLLGAAEDFLAIGAGLAMI